MTTVDAQLKYPVGRFSRPENITPEDLKVSIAEIAALAERLAHAVLGLSDEELDTPYREGGWTVRQVVHHVADSHLNSYVRFRLALTEDAPTIKPYSEAAWAELPDARTAPVQVSLDLLKALHERWVSLMKSMTPEQFRRTFSHPEHGTVPLDTAAVMYAWHSRHHLAHITALRQRRGW